MKQLNGKKNLNEMAKTHSFNGCEKLLQLTRSLVLVTKWLTHTLLSDNTKGKEHALPLK